MMSAFAALLLAGLSTPPGPSSFQSLYDQHRWFELRAKVGAADAPAFFRAATALAFNRPGAEAAVQQVIDQDGKSPYRPEARELLLGAYYRSGRYLEAWREASQILEETPTASDVANLKPILDGLRDFGDQVLEHYRPGRFSMKLDDGNLVLPVSINGVSGDYIFDDGCSVSTISRSEAKRLHLQVKRTSSRIDTMTGVTLGVDVASAREFRIGQVRLRNVAFYVVPDAQPPFDGLRPGRRGIIGLPVLIALKTMSWSAARKTFSIGEASRDRPQSPNLAFDGTSVFAQATFRQKAITFSLDTGAQKTVLYPRFGVMAPDVMGQGQVQSHTLTGVGGASTVAAESIPPVTFSIGGTEATLETPTVLKADNNATSGRFAGNLGMDLLSQARRTTLDFMRMTLTRE